MSNTMVAELSTSEFLITSDLLLRVLVLVQRLQV